MTLALHRMGNGVASGTPDALYALAEAPGLVIDERGETLEVRRVKAGFALAEQREGAAPSLSLGDVLVPFSQISPRLQSSGCVAHFVPERGAQRGAARSRDCSPASGSSRRGAAARLARRGMAALCG